MKPRPGVARTCHDRTGRDGAKNYAGSISDESRFGKRVNGVCDNEMVKQT
jgi:hypothetical protein